MTELNSSEEKSIRERVSAEFSEAKEFAKSLNFDEIKSGDWFNNILQRVIRAYDRNARAAYFQQKYPGLPPDEIADILTSVTVRYAALAGAIAGAATSAAEIAALGSAGMTVALMATAIGTEMIYLSRIQIRLILDLSVVYDLQLNADDPEDTLMIFGYALGVAPTGLAGQALGTATAALTKSTVKQHISKNTLRAIQNVARQLGFKVLQRTILKYAVPIAAAAVGSTYNFLTTRAIGNIAKAHFKSRGKVTEELRQLVSRQNTYEIAFPAAALYMAQVDGEFSPQEKELYRAILSRLSVGEHTQAEFRKLLTSEKTLLDTIAQNEDVEFRRTLIDVLSLMAIYDGKLTDEEQGFLTTVTNRLDIPIDLQDILRKCEEYRVVVKETLAQKSAGAVKSAATQATSTVNKGSEKIRDAVAKFRKGTTQADNTE